MEKKDKNKWTNKFRTLGKKKGSRQDFIKLYKEILSTTKKSKTARADVESQLNDDDITLPLYEKFNQLWNERQISIISALLQEAEEAKETDEKEELNALLNAVDQLLQTKENSSVKLINKFALNLTKL